MTERMTPPRRPSGRSRARPWLVALLVVLSAAPTAGPAAARAPFATHDADAGPVVRRHAPPALVAGDDPLADGTTLPSVHYRHAAWVSTLGSSRGAARVFVDGVLVATVNTHSTTTLHRRVVFTRTWSTVGTHTLRIVVAGTAGHARVDLDALEIVR